VKTNLEIIIEWVKSSHRGLFFPHGGISSVSTTSQLADKNKDVFKTILFLGVHSEIFQKTRLSERSSAKTSSPNTSDLLWKILKFRKLYIRKNSELFGRIIAFWFAQI